MNRKLVALLLCKLFQASESYLEQYDSDGNFMEDQWGDEEGENFELTEEETLALEKEDAERMEQEAIEEWKRDEKVADSILTSEEFRPSWIENRQKDFLDIFSKKVAEQICPKEGIRTNGNPRVNLMAAALYKFGKTNFLKAIENWENANLIEVAIANTTIFKKSECQLQPKDFERIYERFEMQSTFKDNFIKKYVPEHIDFEDVKQKWKKALEYWKCKKENKLSELQFAKIRMLQYPGLEERMAAFLFTIFYDNPEFKNVLDMDKLNQFLEMNAKIYNSQYFSRYNQDTRSTADKYAENFFNNGDGTESAEEKEYCEKQQDKLEFQNIQKNSDLDQSTDNTSRSSTPDNENDITETPIREADTYYQCKLNDFNLNKVYL